MKKSIKRSLEMMLETNEKMANRIVDFLNRVPEKLKDKIYFQKTEGKCRNDDEAWVFTNIDDNLCISLGSAKNKNKDYMNISIYGKTPDQLDKELRKLDEVLLGYVTFFLYNPNKREKPTQLCYNFILTKQKLNKYKYNVDLRTRTNTKLKEMAELIELNGFADMVKEISDHGAYTLSNVEVKEQQKVIMQ